MAEEPNQGAAGGAPGPSTTYERGSAAYAESPLSVETLGGAYEDRPELFVGAAFLGGFLVAQILKKVGG
jgi:hypothetical protein